MGQSIVSMLPLAALLVLSHLVEGEEFPRNLCTSAQKTCKFTLEITHMLTMRHDGNLVVPCSGDLCYHTGLPTSTTPQPLTEKEKAKVIQADGYWESPRTVIVANGQMPGPVIQAYAGQTLEITVHNKLLSEGVTIHWHGVDQMNTTYMDGVPYVNQCPIMPGQSFTYKFRVYTSGTDFYHAHIGAQQTQGLFGPLITKPLTTTRDPRVDLNKLTEHILDPDSSEHIMVLNDWNHDYDSTTAYLLSENGLFQRNTTDKFIPYKAPDGSSYSPWIWHSGLINGRGRYDHDGKLAHNGAPLTKYTIQSDGKGGYKPARFRVIAAGTLFPLRVSVEHHDLRMVSADGNRFREFPVESFILSPGERFDFLVDGNQTEGCYKIYATTLEVIEGGKKPHRAEAVLQYEGHGMSGNDFDGDSCFNVAKGRQDRWKTSGEKRVVLNCPFKDYATKSDSRCKHLVDLSAMKAYYPLQNKSGAIIDYADDKFFNFAFPYGKASINGLSWVSPPVASASQYRELNFKDCDKCSGKKEACECTHIEGIKGRKYNQFILTSVGKGIGPGHPIHLHGHGFGIIKQGFAEVGADGKADSSLATSDIQCESTEVCNQPSFKNKIWKKNLIPKDNVKNFPIKKDTVMVPYGGYVVIRFYGDNPGFWYMHCQNEIHNLGGMAMMLREAYSGFTTKYQPPLSFPVCRNFPSARKPSSKTIRKTNTRGRTIVGRRKPGGAGVALFPATAILSLALLANFMLS